MPDVLLFTLSNIADRVNNFTHQSGNVVEIIFVSCEDFNSLVREAPHQYNPQLHDNCLEVLGLSIIPSRQIERGNIYFLTRPAPGYTCILSEPEPVERIPILPIVGRSAARVSSMVPTGSILPWTPDTPRRRTFWEHLDDDFVSQEWIPDK